MPRMDIVQRFKFFYETICDEKNVDAMSKFAWLHALDKLKCDAQTDIFKNNIQMTGSDLAALRVLVHLIEEKLCAV